MTQEKTSIMKLNRMFKHIPMNKEQKMFVEEQRQMIKDGRLSIEKAREDYFTKFRLQSKGDKK